MAITATQKTKRINHIGSSDAAAILGLDPYKTPGDVLLAKTGQVEEFEGNERTWIGTQLEPALRAMAAERLGCKVVAPTATYVHSAGLLAANIDGQIEKAARGQPIVEIKTTGNAAEWGEPGSDDVPDRIIIQIHHQMICSDAKEAHVVRLLADRGLKFDVYHIRRDDAMAEEMIEYLSTWWGKYIVNGDPLPPDSAPSLDVAKRRAREPGKCVQLDPALVKVWRDANEKFKEAKEAEETAKAAVVAALSDAEIGEIPGMGIVTYTQSSRKGYTVSDTTYRTLRFKESK